MSNFQSLVLAVYRLALIAMVAYLVVNYSAWWSLLLVFMLSPKEEQDE